MVYMLPPELAKHWGVGASTIAYHVGHGNLRILEIPGVRQARIEAAGILWTEATELPRGILDTEALANLFRMAPSRCLRLLKQGRLPGTKRLNRWSCSQTTLRAWIEEHTHGQHNAELLKKRRRIYFEASLGDLSQARPRTGTKGEG